MTVGTQKVIQFTPKNGGKIFVLIFVAYLTNLNSFWTSKHWHHVVFVLRFYLNLAIGNDKMTTKINIFFSNLDKNILSMLPNLIFQYFFYVSTLENLHLCKHGFDLRTTAYLNNSFTKMAKRSSQWNVES